MRLGKQFVIALAACVHFGMMCSACFYRCSGRLHAADAMDFGFALQARCLEAVACGTVTATSCVAPVPASIDAAVASSYLKTRYPVGAPRHGHEPQSLKGSGGLQALTKRTEAFFWGAPWGVPSKEHGHAPLKRTGDVRLFRQEAILRPHVLESRHAAMADSRDKHREVVDGEVKRSA